MHAIDKKDRHTWLNGLNGRYTKPYDQLGLNNQQNNQLLHQSFRGVLKSYRATCTVYKKSDNRVQ